MSSRVDCSLSCRQDDTGKQQTGRGCVFERVDDDVLSAIFLGVRLSSTRCARTWSFLGGIRERERTGERGRKSAAANITLNVLVINNLNLCLHSRLYALWSTCD